MKILLAASEAQPFIKTGGLADVAGTLPLALKKLGQDVRVILPKYRLMDERFQTKLVHVSDFYIKLGWRSQYCGIDMLKHEGVTFYFVDNAYYFSRDYIYGGSDNDEAERFAFFSKAILEAMPKIGFFPDVLHCNDWQTGMAAALLKLQYAQQKGYAKVRTLFTIHNLRYQGVFDRGFVNELLTLGNVCFSPKGLEYFSCVNYLKAGLVFSDAISTVSPTYAKEIQTPEFGETLENVLLSRKDSLYGILNGIDNDFYNPRTDKHIPARFPLKTMRGKTICKAALRREVDLEKNSRAPIIAMVTRLTEQKGLDLLEYAIDDLMRRDVQLTVLGAGDMHYSNMLSHAAWKYPGRVSLRFEYNEPLAHRYYAGADMFLMPSRFEPCGLSQMIAMRYGAIPIVRETGGLADTVPPYNKFTNEGMGFTFKRYDAPDMLGAIDRALSCYYDDPDAWKPLRERALCANFGWDRSAQRYLELYEKI